MSMFKDSKLNKSPIESIMQDSFQSTTKAPGFPQDPYPSHSRKQDAPEFTKSNQMLNPNLDQAVESKLIILKMMSNLQLETAIQGFVTVVKNKVLNNLYWAITRIRNAPNARAQSLTIFKSDQFVVVKKIQILFQKIDAVFKASRLKLMSCSFTAVYQLRTKNIVSDKSSSIVSPYRGSRPYIKDHSERGDSSWQIAQSQDNMGSQDSIIKENRFLKNKKQKTKKSRQQFYNKMDEILSVHEAFLTKK